MLVITLGEVESINTRAISYLLNEIPNDHETVIVGSKAVWESQLQRNASLTVEGNPVLSRRLLFIENIFDLDNLSDTKHCFLDVTKEARNPGDLKTGEAAVKALNALAEITNYCEHRNKKLAVLTCPIDKSKASSFGFSYPGHTEYFEKLWQDNSIMILAGDKLKVGLVTNHLALSEVPDAISKKLLIQKFETLSKTLKLIYGKNNVNIAVCGLNPHLSDSGMFGTEEEMIIEPAIRELKANGHALELCPADTAFFYCYSGNYDAVLAMYHDQGLAPLKTVHFDTAVNITGGLKHLRVSPDHGPAADKIDSNEISVNSFRSALNYCITYLEQ